MPTLNWIGKDKVVNHHLEVPYMIVFAKKSFLSPLLFHSNLVQYKLWKEGSLNDIRYTYALRLFL